MINHARRHPCRPPQTLAVPTAMAVPTVTIADMFRTHITRFTGTPPHFPERIPPVTAGE